MPRKLTGTEISVYWNGGLKMPIQLAECLFPSGRVRVAVEGARLVLRDAGRKSSRSCKVCFTEGRSPMVSVRGALLSEGIPLLRAAGRYEATVTKNSFSVNLKRKQYQRVPQCSRRGHVVTDLLRQCLKKPVPKAQIRALAETSSRSFRQLISILRWEKMHGFDVVELGDSLLLRKTEAKD